MALNVHPKMAGGVRYAEPLYYIASQIGRDKITGAIVGKLVGYANEAARRAHAAAIARVVHLEIKLGEINAALNQLAAVVADGAEVSTETRASVEDNAIRLHGERQQVSALLRAAKLPLENDSISPVASGDFLVPSHLAAPMIREDGSVDEAQVYAWLKTGKDFSEVEDA